MEIIPRFQTEDGRQIATAVRKAMDFEEIPSLQPDACLPVRYQQANTCKAAL